MRLKKDTRLRLSNNFFLTLPKNSEVVVLRNPRRVVVNSLVFFKAGKDFFASVYGEVLQVLPIDGREFNPHPPFPLSLIS